MHLHSGSYSKYKSKSLIHSFFLCNCNYLLNMWTVEIHTDTHELKSEYMHKSRVSEIQERGEQGLTQSRAGTLNRVICESRKNYNSARESGN